MPWKKHSYRPARFVVAGTLATGAHWLVMAAMIHVGLLPAVATATGALVGAVVNYILQRNVTFQSTVSHRLAVGRYVLASMVAWCGNLALFVFLHHGLHLAPLYAQVLTTLVIAFMNYHVYKKIVFHETKLQPDH